VCRLLPVHSHLSARPIPDGHLGPGFKDGGAHFSPSQQRTKAAVACGNLRSAQGLHLDDGDADNAPGGHESGVPHHKIAVNH